MGKIVIGCITPVTDIDSRRAAGSICHLAEGAVFIMLPAGLDDEVSETPVQDGITCIYVCLVTAFRGFCSRPIKGIRVIRIAEDIQGGAVTGDELVFPVIQVIFQLPAECKQQVPEHLVPELLQLLIISGLGRHVCGAPEICADFLFDAFPFHGEQHEEKCFEAELPAANSSIEAGSMAFTESEYFIMCTSLD